MRGEVEHFLFFCDKLVRLLDVLETHWQSFSTRCSHLLLYIHLHSKTIILHCVTDSFAGSSPLPLHIIF